MRCFSHFWICLALVLLGPASALFAGEPSSGAITEGTQYIRGQKIFEHDQLNVATLTGNATLDIGSKRFQKLNPSGAHRNVTLPAENLSAGLVFWFINSGSGNNIVVKDPATNTVLTVQQDQAGFVVCSGTAWSGFAFGVLGAGALESDGSVAGATGQAQDFGTNGIAADVIAESTGAAGVTIDGVLLKDARIPTLNGTNIDAGLSGTAGSVDIFPATGSKGKLAFVATNNTGNDTTTITNAAQGGAYTYTIPDAGASTDFVVLAGAQTISGAKTFSGVQTFNHQKLAVRDSGGDHSITIESAADNAAARALQIPALAGTNVILTDATAQTVTGVKTMTGANIITHANASGLKILDTGGDHTLAFITATDEAADYTVTVPDLAGNDTLMTLATAQTVTGIKTMSGANIVTHAPTGLKIQDSNASHLVTIAPGDESADRTLSLPVLGGAQTLVTLGNDQTFSGAITFNATAGKFVRASQRYRYSGNWKVGGAAGFVVDAANNLSAATCPASQTAAVLIIPVTQLKVGSIITAFGLLGQIESAGNNVTVDCDLRKQTTAAGDFTDASVSTMTQIAVATDTAIDSTQDKTGLSTTVLQTESYYFKITVTTDAATDVDIRGATLVITEQ
ncbi:MAG: hypothetical protein HS116_18445 [Planctomycetes bacterium]|nr:hypothetical protein [Planctomycetota bacterium]